ncbi:MAG: hypothetical protein QXK24_02115 [Ignisphaera sp.]
MPLYKRYRRERGITRDRYRFPHSGAFVTVTKGSFIYAYDFPPTEPHYAKEETYTHPYPHPYGYIFPPPPTPTPRVIGTVVMEETFVPTSEIITPPPIVPTEQKTRTIFTAGTIGSLTPGTTSVPLSSTEYPIAQVLILADSANSGKIWINYKAPAVVGASFPLDAGAAKLFTIDDLSDIWVVAENDTDKLYYVVDVP